MTSLLNDNAALVEALGWTILHSLWQATLLAGLLWLGSRLTRSARTRYGLAYGTLLTQLAVSVFTLTSLFEVDVAETVHTTVGPLMMTDFTAAEASPAYWNPGMLLFWIVVFWAVGLLIGAVRLGISFGRVRRMQRSVEGAVPDHFRATVLALAQRIGYHGPLHLKISAELGGPALVGHLKPLLLFPVAVVNQLTTDEAEAVILHELAHLKRQDHWWNLLQCLIEVIFYYHPVVWWIGARIREEREHCCDDLVLQHGPDRLAYAKALLYFEHQRATPATAVALTNNPSGLLGRVRRFLHQQNIPYQMKSRLFLLPLLAIIALVSTAVYNPAEKALDAVAVIGETAADVVGTAIENRPFAPAPAPKIASLPIVPLSLDSLPPGRHKVTTYRNGSSTEVLVEDQEIKELIIDGKVIPEVEYNDHMEKVEKLLGTHESGQQNSRHWSDGDEDHSLYRLKKLKGLRSLESLEGLRSLESLEKLEGLKRLESLEGLKGLESLERLEDLEGIFLDMDGNWEALGERLGKMGDELGRSFEGFFEFNDVGKSYRFNIERDGDFFKFDKDSISGGTFRFNDDRNIWELDGQAIRPNSAQDKESEIQEMETMIERLERRKAEMQRDLERVEKDKSRATSEQERYARDSERMMQQQQQQQQQQERAERLREEEARMHEMHEKNAGPDYESMVSQLQREGLLEGSEPLKKLFVGDGKLKVNGKKASGDAYQRFLQIYQERYGKDLAKNSSIKVTINN